MGPLVRLVDASTRLARRRARYMTIVFGALGTCVVVLCDLLPAEHRARAVVAPSGPGRVGPIERIRELALSPASLAEVADVASVADSRTLGEWVAGRAPDPGLRVVPEVLVVRGAERELEHVIVLASGRTADQARRAADALADRVVALDAGLASGQLPAERGLAPPSAAAQARLAAYRAEHGPLLRDVGLEERHRALAVRVAEERAALVGLRAQLVGAGEESDRLEVLARDEAAQAHALHRDEEAARALAAAPAPALAPAPAPAPPPPAAADRLSALEAELQRLLVTFTERHPEVRRLQRQVEAERRAQAAAPAAPRAPGAPQEAAARRPEVASAELPGLVFAVADDAPPAPGAAGPEAWLTRAPSYGLWAAARARVEATRVEVEAREQALAVRTGELATLERALAAQTTVRAEEARLAADAAAELALAPPAPLDPAARLAVVERATVIDSRSPWALLLPGVVLAGLASVLLGVAVDAADRTLHRREELEALGVTVLGVIPRVGR